jgi:MFS transporter, PAT family, beta-lactamase induction signal transducer AmpG
MFSVIMIQPSGPARAGAPEGVLEGEQQAAMRRNVLDTRLGRLLTFGALYVSEGIPLGFTAVAMAAYMRRGGLDVSQVGSFVATLYLPWAFKWAWAPLLDLIKLERFGGRRAWIALCLVAMIGTLIAAGRVDFIAQYQLVVVLVFIHNVFASTNDVAIDSLAVNTLEADERGRANGFMFGGAYLGQGLGGGGAMFVASLWGFDAALVYACALLGLVLAFVLLFVYDRAPVERAGASAVALWRAAVSSVVRVASELYAGFLRSGRGPLVGIVFALVPAGAMALTTAVGTTIQVDLGLSDTDIGALNLYSTIFSAIGCIAGGWLGDLFGLRKMIAIFYAMTALPTLYLAVVLSSAGGLGGLGMIEFYVAYNAAAFFTGLHYGVSAAVFMGLTNPAVAATQFTAFMALRNLTIAYTNGWQGIVVEASSYATVFYLDAVLVILPLILLPFLTPRAEARAGAAQSAGAPMPEAG